MAVQFIFRHLSDERAIFREDLVAFGVAGEFVEPVSAGECILPYLPIAELLEVRHPRLTISLENKRAQVYSCYVWSSERNEPNGHAPVMNLFHGLPGSLVFGVFFIALVAADWKVVLSYGH